MIFVSKNRNSKNLDENEEYCPSGYYGDRREEEIDWKLVLIILESIVSGSEVKEVEGKHNKVGTEPLSFKFFNFFLLDFFLNK